MTVLHVDCTHDANREAHAFDLLDEREKKRWASFLLKDAQTAVRPVSGRASHRPLRAV